MFQFGLYRVLIIQLGVLLGFYTFNVHKYNFGNLKNLRADKIVHTPCDLWHPDPRLGTTDLGYSSIIIIMILIIIIIIIIIIVII